MATAFVFDPKGNYRVVGKIREAEQMPAEGLRYVASVTGPFKTFQVVEFGEIALLGDRLDALPGGGGSDDPPNAIVPGAAKVRKSRYATHTAIVRIDARPADPGILLPQIREVIGEDTDGGVEADVVIGDFDILACIVDDDEEIIKAKILGLRGIDGIRRTVSLRVIDYVSTSDNAPPENRVEPASPSG
jgi:hypothetical protein